MTPRVKPNHYRVGWKVKGKKEVVADYAFPTMAELMIHLKKSEGITTLNVEQLYVHQIHSDGNIEELVAIEPEDKPGEEKNRPAVRKRPSRVIRRRQLADALLIGSFHPPTAADRDDVEADIIPWPAGITGMYDEEEDWFLNKITEILLKAKTLRERPKSSGVPISQAMYTAYPAVTTE